MRYTVRYTPKAQTDMDGIWDLVYSVSRNYEIADAYIDGLIAAVEGKRQFPRSGSPRLYRGLFTGYYSVLFKKYLAFYRVKEGYIEVVRILSATSDFIKTLLGDFSDK